MAGARPSNTIPRSSKVKVQMLVMFVSVMATLSVFALMWQPGAANGGNARLPPRWELGSSRSLGPGLRT